MNKDKRTYEEIIRDYLNDNLTYEELSNKIINRHRYPTDVLSAREAIHLLSTKKRTIVKRSPKRERRDKEKVFDAACHIAMEHDLFYASKKFVPCRPEEIEVDNKVNFKFNFLQEAIRLNNNFKGIYTRNILDALVTKPEKTFLEFLKVLTETYMMNNSDKRLSEIYDEYIGYYSFLISIERDVTWLRKRKNQVMLYRILSLGGEFHVKAHRLTSVFSFFYSFQKLNSFHEYNDAVKEYYTKDNDVGLTEYNYMTVPFRFETINNLVEYGYINKKHLTAKIRFEITERDFYIPKKKRKKRIYTEDKDIATIHVNYLPIYSILINKNVFDASVTKLVRSSDERGRKIYVKKDEVKRCWYMSINRLKSEEFFNEMIMKIKEK
jgi:hypothetical protein